MLFKAGDIVQVAETTVFNGPTVGLRGRVEFILCDGTPLVRLSDKRYGPLPVGLLRKDDSPETYEDPQGPLVDVLDTSPSAVEERLQGVEKKARRSGLDRGGLSYREHSIHAYWAVLSVRESMLNYPLGV